MAAKTI